MDRSGWDLLLHTDCHRLMGLLCLTGQNTFYSAKEIPSFLSHETLDPQNRRIRRVPCCLKLLGFKRLTQQTVLFKNWDAVPICRKTFFLYRRQTHMRSFLVKLPDQLFPLSRTPRRVWRSNIWDQPEAATVYSMSSQNCLKWCDWSTCWTLALFGRTINQH